MCTACHTNGFGSLPPIDEIHQSNLEWAKATGVTKGIVLQIVSVTGVAAGGTPTIQFTLKDATGANVAPSTMATLSANFGGPMPVPTWNLLGQSLKTATGPDANGVYTKTVGALPATVTAGETVIVELDNRIARTGTRDGTAVTLNEIAPNAVAYVVAGTDAPGTARAFDVPMASCNTCHGQIGDSPSLSGHGGQRNTMEACITCHNPTLTDAARRNDGSTPVSVDMPLMIHKIHAGTTLSQGYVVFGYGNSRNDFSEIAFTRQLNDCKACHTGNAWKEPSTRACITCHDTPAAEAHAELNTTTAGVEACDVCHGAGSTLGADKIHTPVP
jgi:OmcA/MtrC family decaheme c-type cytochrome